MKKFYVYLALATGIALHATAQEAPTIYGYRTFQIEAGENTVRGPVKFKADKPGELTLIADQTPLGTIYGGAYYNYDWYCQVTTKGTQSGVEGWYTVNLEDGTRTLISREGSYAIDLTYDYANKCMYGIGSNNSTLLKLDPATGRTVTMGTMTELSSAVPMLAIAADLDGTLYGVSSTDVLYKINKANGNLTRVGDLGADAGFNQSMTFDHYTGTLYWVNFTDYVLYTIDTKTGAATAIGTVGTGIGESVNALAIPFINAPLGSPDRVTDRKVSVSGKNVTLTWTNPVTDIQGKPIQALTAVKIERDGQVIATVTSSLATGATASYTDTGVADGMHEYRIIPVNSAGEGGVDTKPLSVKIGADAPGAVGNLTATPGDQATILAWTAPIVGANGGEFSPSSITGYVVRRYSGKTATKFDVDASTLTYTDKTSFGKYNYSVAAKNSLGEGPETFINDVVVKPANWIVMGYDTDVTVQPGVEYEFYDQGGPNGNYTNSTQFSLIIRAAAGGYATVSFDMLDIETMYDGLRIYNGLASPETLMGTFDGSLVDPRLKTLSTINSDKALSFEFFADVMGSMAGWKATVKYVKMGEVDLAATALEIPRYVKNGETVEAKVTVANMGSRDIAAGAYTATLHDAAGTELGRAAGVAVPSAGVATVAIPYTATVEGDYDGVYAVIKIDGDSDETNNTTPTADFSVIDKDSEIVILGERESTVSVCPAAFFSNPTISETIYPASLIPASVKDKYITSLSYFYEATQEYPNVNVEVYVGETEESSLKEVTIPASQLTKVFDGNAPILTSTDEWIFPFSEPYLYKGGNIIVLVNKYGANTDNSGISFAGNYYYGEGADYCRFSSAFIDEVGDRFDPNSTFGTTGPMRPDIKFIMSAKAGVDDILADKTDTLDVDVCGNSVTVRGAEGQAVRVYSADGRMVAGVASASESQLFTLPAAGMYIVRTASAVARIIIR